MTDVLDPFIVIIITIIPVTAAIITIVLTDINCSILLFFVLKCWGTRRCGLSQARRLAKMRYSELPA